MKLKYNLIAFLFISLIGTVGHFLYEWSGENVIIGYFFPVNESTWEHLKLLFFPSICFSLIEYFFVRHEVENYGTAITISTILGMLSIVIIFYTYKGVWGKNVDFINILTYYLAVCIMLIVKSRIIANEKPKGQNLNIFSVFICFLITLLFIFFTYNPPSIGIFKTP